MAWDNYGNGEGVYRSTDESSTVWLTAVPDILEELRIGVNERIAITDLAYVAAFETGEGLTFAQAVAAVTALRAKIAALLVASDCYVGDAWPPTVRYETLASLLSIGSYGSSWLTFSRIQDGRIYEQIREAIDVICIVGHGVSRPYNTKVYIGFAGGSLWATVFANAAPDTWSDQEAEWLVYASASGSSVPYSAKRVEGDPGFRIAASTLRIIPMKASVYLTGHVSDTPLDLSITIGEAIFNVHSDPQRVYFTVVQDGIYVQAAVSSNLSASNAPTNPSSSGITMGDACPVLYDIGSTWTKKP